MKRMSIAAAGALSLAAGLSLLTACSNEGGTQSGSSSSAPAAQAASGIPAGLFADAVEGTAKPVLEAKAAASEGDAIVLTGIIAGRRDPFVDGRAVFLVADKSLPICQTECKTPWDFCCEKTEDILANTVTVQVVDASGSPVKEGMRDQNGLAPLSELVIAGTVAQKNGEVMVVNAEKIQVLK